jgi:hypothetical protein
VAHEQPAAAVQLRLPVLVFGMVEVRRLRRELEALEDFIRQREIRTPGTQPQLPRVSRLLEALATENNLQLLQPEHRQELRRLLQTVTKDAPSLHISFAADPSSAFTAKMVTWLRANIHPWALMEVGLQPTIAAGCVVRTSNKVFDFSLREHFTKADDALLAALEKVAAEEAPALPSGVAPVLASPAGAPVGPTAALPAAAVVATTPTGPAVAVQAPVAVPSVAAAPAPAVSAAPSAPVMPVAMPAAPAPPAAAPVSNAPAQLEAIPLPATAPQEAAS